MVGRGSAWKGGRGLTQRRECRNCRGTVSTVSERQLCPACLAIDGLQSNTQNRRERRRSEWTPQSNEEIAALFPELDQVQLIGRGGMGAVYRARQKNLDRVVALKILPPQLMDDPAFAERFAREAQAMARLSHPNILTIHDFGERHGLFFFIMEFVDGVTLRQLTTRGRLSTQEALAIIPQICDALQYAHDLGIVHRDIKPENILLSRRGQVKIADFGLAKLMGTQREALPVPLTATIGAVGTPLYMAPEQIRTPHDVDHRADIYSLGVVFYQLLTGELPGDDTIKPSQISQVDVRLDEVVMRALHHEPGERFQSAQELKTIIQTMTFATAGAMTASPPIVGARSSTQLGRSETDRQTMKSTRAAIATPARGIRYVALFNIAFLCLTTLPALISFIATAPEKVMDSPLGLQLQLPWWATGAFFFTVTSLALNGFVAAGAARMRELRSYGWSVTCAILCLFAAPGNVVGAVFGVWAIIVLIRANTRQAFGVARQELPDQSARHRGMICWMPMVRVHRQRKALDLVNYTIVAVSLWLICYALISLLILGKPASVWYGLLLILPAMAVPQSIARVHRRLSVEAITEARQAVRPLLRIGLWFLLPLGSLLLYGTVLQALNLRDLAERRSAATQPDRHTLADRLHITIPKMLRRAQ